MRRIVGCSVVLAAVAVGCSGGMSLTEYGETAEASILEMNRLVDAAAVDPDSPDLTPAEVGESMKRRADARTAFLEELSAIDPPSQAEGLHATAFEIVTSLRNAELALGVLAGANPDASLDSIWSSPEAAALAAIDEEGIALCERAQASFDATAEREAFADSEWIPPELKEVVVVAFKCSFEDRGGSDG